MNETDARAAAPNIAATVSVPEPFLVETASGAREPYDPEASTIRLSITIHPAAADGTDRLVAIAATTHDDAPIVEVVRLSEIGSVPEPVARVLDALFAALPDRRRLAVARYQIDCQKKLADEASVAARKAAAKPAARPAARPPARPPAAQATPPAAKSAAAEVTLFSLTGTSTEVQNG